MEVTKFKILHLTEELILCIICFVTNLELLGEFSHDTNNRQENHKIQTQKDDCGKSVEDVDG